MSRLDDFHDFEQSLLSDWMLTSQSDYPNLQQQVQDNTNKQNHALLNEMSDKYQLIDPGI